MSRYLVEQYVPASAAPSLGATAARLRSQTGRTVCVLTTFYAAEDEICFHLFDAPSASAVRRTGVRAGVQIERIVSVVTVDDEQPVQT